MKNLFGKRSLSTIKAVVSYTPKNAASSFIVLDESGRLSGYHPTSASTQSLEAFKKAYPNYTPKNSQGIRHSSSSISTLCKQFPNDGWKEIIPHLHPNASAILDIKNTVNNIDYYNLCIPHQDALEGVDYDRAVRNLSKALRYFPPLAKIALDNKKGREILHSFIQGVPSQPVEKLLSYLKIPLANRSFLKRASGLHPYLIKTLYDCVLTDLINDEDQLNLKLYGEKISSIPLPIDTRNYEAMRKILRYFHDTHEFLTQETKHKMFNEITKRDLTWVANSTALNTDFEPSIQEYLTTIALYLVLPIYIEKFNKEIDNINNTKQKNYNHFPDRYNHWFTKHILGELALFLQSTVVDNHTPQEITNYTEEYWRRASQINEARPGFIKRVEEFEKENYTSYPEWTKAFADCEIDGVEFHCLVNERELKQEASNVGHCGGGYGQRCRNGTRHIVSGSVTDTGEIFTLRLTSQNNFTIELDEVVTKKENHERLKLSETASQSITELFTRLNSKEIKTNSKFGSIDKEFTITDVIGCETEELRYLFQAHLDLNILPTKSTNLPDFLEELGFDQYFKERFKHDYNIPNQETPPANIALKEARKANQGPKEEVIIID